MGQSWPELDFTTVKNILLSLRAWKKNAPGSGKGEGTFVSHFRLCVSEAWTPSRIISAGSEITSFWSRSKTNSICAVISWPTGTCRIPLPGFNHPVSMDWSETVDRTTNEGRTWKCYFSETCFDFAKFYNGVWSASFYPRGVDECRKYCQIVLCRASPPVD